MFKEINNKLGNGNGIHHEQAEAKQKEIGLDDLIEQELKSEDPESEELDDCPDPPVISDKTTEKKSSVKT